MLNFSNIKTTVRFSTSIFLLWLIIFISCKKEYSCEGCINGNKPPIANAGPDQVITLPTDSVSLDGTASGDPDGTISSYLWTKISGPASFNIISPTDSITKVKALVTGTYQFELKVTDNGGLSAKDTMQVIVDSVITINHSPIANAGNDTTIILPANTVNLDGSGSTDPDNNITNYLWTKISGPSSFNITNSNAVQTQVTNLVQGTYQFELKVTDAGGLFSKDTLYVIVNAVVSNNIPPVAVCGNDTTIQTNQTSCTPFPLTITLNGSNSFDEDGTITSYLWSGPTGIANPTSATTTVTGVFQGTISFILKVTDNNGATGYDTVRILIIPANRQLVPAQLIPFGTLSIPRGGITVASAGNKVLFAGGRTGLSPDNFSGSTRVDIYDLVTQNWSTAELSIGRAGMNVAVSGNKIFFAGGWDHDDNGFWTFYSNVDIYDASTNTWSVSSLSVPRAYMAGGSVGNKIFFAGGNSSFTNHPGPIENLVDIYDLLTNTWSSSTLSEARMNLSAVTEGNKIYFAGGEQVCPFISKRIDIYDNSTGSWSSISLNEPKTSLAGIAFLGKIYWAGGLTTQPCSGGGNFSNQVEIKDVTTGISSFDCLFQPRSCESVEKNGKLVFFTGDGAPNKFDIYDVTTNTWSIGVLPRDFGSAIISVNNVIYVCDGIQVWKLEF